VFLNRCTNCGRLNPRDSVLCQYCGVSLGHYRICSRGHKNRWDAQFCGVCGDVFLSPAAPPDPIRTVVGWAASGLGFVLLGYLLWEQRFSIFLLIALAGALLYLTAWLFRPFGRVLHLWMPWLFLFRLIRKR